MWQGELDLTAEHLTRALGSKKLNCQDAFRELHILVTALDEQARQAEMDALATSLDAAAPHFSLEQQA